MNIVLLGAPGSGKGTQASLIAGKYGLPHISTGDMFRENIREKTPLGVLAKTYIDKGQLCPDDVTEKMVAERLSRKDCEKGFLLDGFPRTIAQAKALEEIAPLTVVLDIDVPLGKLLKRLTGRRCCEKCGESFHVDSLGGAEDCPKCGGKLYTRADDNEETVQKRLDVYVKQTESLVEYYRSAGLLKKVNGDRAVNEVFGEVEEVLENL